MADTETLTAWLAECENALQAVIMGKSAQAVGHDGKTVTFTPTSEPQLRARIAELKGLLGLATRPRARRPFF